MDIAREASGANYVESVGSYRGQRVRGDVMEYTLRTSHVAFQHPLPFPAYPLVHGQALPCCNHDDQRHGTNTYGIIFGDGTINMAGGKDPLKRGVLPDGEGIIATRLPFYPDDPPDPCVAFPTLTNRYCHISQLVKADHCPTSPPDLNCPYNAVFQNNSWGHLQPASPYYGSVSAEMDHIVFDLDILICAAAGNNPNRIYSFEAYAKNVVTVGGVTHNNTEGASDDYWSSAGRGPLTDGRIKPDLLHFYDQVRTTDSVDVVGNPSDIAYRPEFDGTSAATPITCGHFGLLFQMWADDSESDGKNIFGMPVASCNPATENCVFKRRPHASTARALMINTANQYDWVNGPPPNQNIDRDKQGWGLPNVKNLYDLRNKIVIIDETRVLTQLGFADFTVKVAAGEPALKATMVYTDPPAAPSTNPALVNDLSLKATSPSSVSYWGNNGLTAGLWSVSGVVMDERNPVENVFTQNPEPGIWSIRVKAFQIAQDGHVETVGQPWDADFALVISGAVAVGACHLPGGGCVITDRADCLAQSGTYDGDHTVCCPPTCQ